MAKRIYLTEAQAKELEAVLLEGYCTYSYEAKQAARHAESAKDRGDDATFWQEQLARETSRRDACNSLGAMLREKRTGNHYLWGQETEAQA